MKSGLRTLLPLFGTVVFSIMTFLMLLTALIFAEQMWISILLAILFGGGALFLGLQTLGALRSRRDSGVSGLGQERSRLLKLASHQKGRVTAEEAAMECRIPVQQAQALLDQLVNQGTADTWVSDNGSMVYVFRGLLEDEKDSAEDPMKLLEP